MGVKRIYSIYDRVAEKFGPLFEAENDGVAMRSFKNFAEGQKISIEEYWLFYVGGFDDKSGKMNMIDSVERVEHEAMLALDVNRE